VRRVPIACLAFVQAAVIFNNAGLGNPSPARPENLFFGAKCPLAGGNSLLPALSRSLIFWLLKVRLLARRMDVVLTRRYAGPRRSKESAIYEPSRSDPFGCQEPPWVQR
jgi:hypothetical protein